jgi:hypothetical protein
MHSTTIKGSVCSICLLLVAVVCFLASHRKTPEKKNVYCIVQIDFSPICFSALPCTLSLAAILPLHLALGWTRIEDSAHQTPGSAVESDHHRFKDIF